MSGNFCAVIGSPIAGSLSPAMHAAEFRRRGADVDYVAVETLPDEIGSTVARLVADGVLGISVTMPLKATAFDLVDEHDESAARCRSVNTIVVDRERGRLVGADTDGEGAVEALVRHGATLRGARCTILGAGGAARAILHALVAAGVGAVHVVARDPERAAAAVEGVPIASASSLDVARGSDIVVNATPLGMSGVHPGATPVPASWHVAAAVVLDCVYRPLETPFLADARAAGATTVDGLWMLAAQAVGQQRWWFDHRADVEVMRAAALAVLAQR